MPSNYTRKILKDLNLRRYYVSQGETILYDFISEFYNKPIIRNDRNVLGSQKELDLYLPENNLAIEYHGSFWHSNIGEEKHKEKYLLARQKNLNLIQIFDWELEEKESIVFSIIKTRLGIFDEKIFARNCIIKELSNNEYKFFCDENHIQGYCSAKIKLGLFHDGELVSIMSFSKPRFSKKYTYEMIRYACRCDTLIIGAATKLFSYFCKNYEFKSIVTFSDNRLFEGKLYEKLGFTFSHETSPNYWYTTGENKISRISAQKHKLKDLLGEENFNDSLSEKDNMLLNGYRIVYDAGNKVFIFNK